MKTITRGGIRLLAMILMITGWGIAQAEYDAAGIYELRCSSCHGVNGEGTKAPPLAPPLQGNALVLNAPVEVLKQVIRKGRSGRQRVYDEGYPNMPAFSAISVSDVEALIEYLKGDLQN